VQTRLLKHLTDHNILSKEQYGFRTKLKTDNATYHLTNEILNALNNNLLLFIVNNGDYCVSKNVYHNINTRQKKLFKLASVIIRKCIIPASKCLTISPT
jgi:NDP-sugar pyrophosphorylase family protein